MDLSEFPLLNRPALMLLMLKAAGDTPATLAACRARLAMELGRIHEHPDVPEPVIAAELEEVRKHLLAAGLLEPAGGDAATLTRRGRKVLAEHPLGVDETVLAAFPEYRSFLRNFARRRTIDDPRLSRYDEGYDARLAGQSLSENPYPPDSVDHLAWENGWSEGGDTDRERRG
jgi:restriction system protein